MKMSRFAIAGAALVAFGLLAPAGAADKNTGSDSNPCGDGNSQMGSISWNPAQLWPPNHKAQNINVTYTDPDGGTNTLTLTTNPHNEIVDGEEVNGTGNTPSATDSTAPAGPQSGANPLRVTVTAVSERSGHKNPDGGRLYEFDYVASNDSDSDGTPDDGCMTVEGLNGDGIVVFVPHDCRNGGCRAKP